MADQLRSTAVYDDPAPYSQGISHEKTVYLAGQVPDDENGTIVGDDIDTQTKQALANVERVLEEAGSSLEEVVSATVFLTDMDDLSGFNEAYATVMPDPKPARATVAVTELAVDARVEIQVIATTD